MSSSSSMTSTRRKFPARLWLDHPPRNTLGFHIMEITILFGIPGCGLLYLLARSRYRAKQYFKTISTSPSNNTVTPIISKPNSIIPPPSTILNTNNIPQSETSNTIVSSITSINNEISNSKPLSIDTTNNKDIKPVSTISSISSSLTSSTISPSTTTELK